MDKRLISAVIISSVAVAGFAAAPASAQDYYGRDGYRQQYQGDGYDYDQDARYQNQLRQRQIQRSERQRRAQYQYDQRYARNGYECGWAWKRDPGSGVIGVEKGPLIPLV